MGYCFTTRRPIVDGVSEVARSPWTDDCSGGKRRRRSSRGSRLTLRASRKRACARPALALTLGVIASLLCASAGSAATVRLHTAFPSALAPSQQAVLTAADGGPGDQFGGNLEAAAIDGNTVVVGAMGKNFNTGAAYVFVRSGSTWSQQAELTASDGSFGDNFGFAVGISGSTIVVGEPSQNGGTGAVYVFVRSGAVWTQQAEVHASDAQFGSGFGRALAIDGATLIAGADGANEAYIFTRSGTTWSQRSRMSSSDGDGFGWSVALSGSMAVVGAPSTNSGTGAAYVFNRLNNGTWYQNAELTGSDGSPGGQFGYSCGITGSTAVVGAVFQNGSGEAYVFSGTRAGWSQRAELTASDAAPSDNFGTSAAIVGSPGHATVVIGANGKNSNVGAAYIFTSAGMTWGQHAKLTASDGVANDVFGTGVAISGTTAVVSAPGRNSSTGAAYIFTNA